MPVSFKAGTRELPGIQGIKVGLVRVLPGGEDGVIVQLLVRCIITIVWQTDRHTDRQTETPVMPMSRSSVSERDKKGQHTENGKQRTLRCRWTCMKWSRLDGILLTCLRVDSWAMTSLTKDSHSCTTVVTVSRCCDKTCASCRVARATETARVTNCLSCALIIINFNVLSRLSCDDVIPAIRYTSSGSRGTKPLYNVVRSRCGCFESNCKHSSYYTQCLNCQKTGGQWRNLTGQKRKCGS